MTAWKGHKSSVYFDARDDAYLVKAVYKGSAISVALKESLLVQDSTRDVLSNAWAGEQQACVLIVIVIVIIVYMMQYIRVSGCVYNFVATSGISYKHTVIKSSVYRVTELLACFALIPSLVAAY